MQRAQSVGQENQGTQGPRARGHNVLLNLAGPLLELTLKLKTGDIPASNELRPVVEDLLRQLEQSAESLGVPHRQTQDVKFALVAFVDETVLSPAHHFPLRDVWEKNALQLIHFKHNIAGQKFFERLDALMQNVEAEADVLEVYYLCLLLGYKGRYNLPYAEIEKQLQQVVQNLAGQLRRTGRLKANALSGHWLANDQPPPPRPPGLPLWVKIAGPAFVGFAFVVYVILYVLLRNDIHVAR
jgi:type VI secretion system protein ImpK